MNAPPGLRAAVAAAACAALLAPAVASATSSSVYVTNQAGASVSQYDIGAGAALAAKTPTAVDAQVGPFSVAISPDGKSVYVANEGGNTVSQYSVGAFGLLSPKTPAMVATGTQPLGVAVAPDGKSVYVTNSGNDHSVSEYDVGGDGTLTPKVPAMVAAGTTPTGIAVAPDGQSVYVANFGSDNVSQFDVRNVVSHAQVQFGVLQAKTPATVDAVNAPEGVALTPNGKSVYVGSAGGSLVGQFDVGAGGALSAKTPATATAGTTPWWVAVTPDGKSAYVANDGSNDISQFDVGAGQLLAPKSPATAALPGSANRVAVTPDGGSVYAPTGNQGIAQFDVLTGGLLAAKSPPTATGGSNPAGVAVAPDQGPVAAFGATPAAAGSATSFDGSASHDSDGTIARYDWDFGDGTTLTNGGATPTHAYSAPGTYTAKLTVTDDGGCSTAFVFTGQTAYCNGGAAAAVTHTVDVPAPADQGAPAPPGLPLSPPAGSPALTLAGSIIPSPTGVRASLTCSAPTGTTCHGRAQLVTVERLAGRKVVGLRAAARRRTRRVTIGSRSFSLAAGQRSAISVPLNATGRRLLRHFSRVPATLSFSLLDTSPPTVLSTRTTIKAARKKKRH